MSAGKVLALVVVVASFAIVSVAVSWCFWCVRSRFGTADQSIQAVKSVATVADTMDSSARAAKSSLLSATFPTTVTTATMTHPRATASEPRMLNPAAEVDAPAKQSLPLFASAIYHSAVESASTTPSTAGAAVTQEESTPKPADNSATSSPPKATRPHDDQLWKPFPGASDGLQTRVSKVELFIYEDNTDAPQSVRRSSQPSAPGCGADGLKLTKLEAGTEHASAVKALELGDCDDENVSSNFESASDTTSRRDSESTKSMTRSLLCRPATDRKFLDQKSTRHSGPGTLPAGSSATQPTPECRTLAVLNSSGQRPRRIPIGRMGAAVGCEEIIVAKQQSGVSPSPYKDASEVTSAPRGRIPTAVMEKKDVERTPSIKALTKSKKFEGFMKARGATTRPTIGAEEKLVEKEGVKPSQSAWTGKRSLLRKAQRAAAAEIGLSPRKGSGMPEVSIVINVPKKEISMLEVTKEQMLASANHCSASATK
ncbi:hypothetical protein HPB49_020272 [Dermacentor silvarum]|uniref:Uncharacterized protein n=1 Tax=Dermacentor silvarum TaxID=543639 RepID=A0ACB8C5A5_DERSI|nr:hypothetical protein HPB49_020272 [Dermacentor silvarum]